jgi:hypothetical protein
MGDIQSGTLELSSLPQKDSRSGAEREFWLNRPSGCRCTGECIKGEPAHVKSSSGKLRAKLF